MNGAFDKLWLFSLLKSKPRDNKSLKSLFEQRAIQWLCALDWWHLGSPLLSMRPLEGVAGAKVCSFANQTTSRSHEARLSRLLSSSRGLVSISTQSDLVPLLSSFLRKTVNSRRTRSPAWHIAGAECLFVDPLNECKGLTFSRK